MGSLAIDEKPRTAVEHVERLSETPDPSKSPDGELLAPDVRAAAERRLIWILDMRLLPTIILIYIMNYIDVRNRLDTPLKYVEGEQFDAYSREWRLRLRG